MPGPKVVFFDLGDTLGTPRTDGAGAIVRFEVFPFALEVLAKMKAAPPAGFGARLGVISNTPSTSTASSMGALLSAAGILSFFEPALLLYSSVEGQDKSKKSFFSLAATRAGVPAGRCIFTGELESERSVAKSAGFLTSFHPLHTFEVLKSMP